MKAGASSTPRTPGIDQTYTEGQPPDQLNGSKELTGFTFTGPTSVQPTSQSFTLY